MLHPATLIIDIRQQIDPTHNEHLTLSSTASSALLVHTTLGAAFELRADSPGRYSWTQAPSIQGLHTAATSGTGTAELAAVVTQTWLTKMGQAATDPTWREAVDLDHTHTIDAETYQAAARLVQDQRDRIERLARASNAGAAYLTTAQWSAATSQHDIAFPNLAREARAAAETMRTYHLEHGAPPTANEILQTHTQVAQAGPTSLSPAQRAVHRAVHRTTAQTHPHLDAPTGVSPLGEHLHFQQFAGVGQPDVSL